MDYLIPMTIELPEHVINELKFRAAMSGLTAAQVASLYLGVAVMKGGIDGFRAMETGVCSKRQSFDRVV